MRRAQIRLLFLLLLLPGLALTAEARQQSAEVIGVEESFDDIPPELSRSLLGHNSVSDISPILKEWLASRGYFDAEIDSVSETAERLSIYVNEGCIYRLGSAEIRIDSEEAESDLSMLGSESGYTGAPFTPDLIRELSGYWLSGLAVEGYMLSEFKIDEILLNREECTAALRATVLPGDKMVVRGVRFDGLHRNDPDYLRRVSGIRGGETITPGLFERGRRNLTNSGLFDSVSDGEIIFVDGEPFVLYVVDEQQLNFFDGLIGYVPDATGSGNIAGYGDILLRNTVAEGNILDLRYEQLQPLVSKLNVQAGQNFIGGFPLRLGAALHFTQQDSSYLVRNIELNSGYRILPGFEITGHIRAERSTVAEEQMGSTGAVALNSRANFYGLGFNIRNTNRFRVPTSGYDGRLVFERGRRFINDERLVDGGRVSFTQTILRGDLRGYIPLGNRPVLAPRVQGMFLESSEFLITDLFRFGGAESLRGFREDQFRASAAAWGELEGRYMLDRSSYLFLFGAYGIYNRPQLINEETNQLATVENLTSLGFGLAFQSPLGIIKFSYAISPDDDLANGKVHVGITTGL